MSRSKYLKLFLWTFFTGVALGSVFEWGILTLLFVSLSILVFVGGRFLFKESREIILVTLIVAVAFLFGIFRIFLTVPVFDIHHIGYYRNINGSLTIRGVVAGEPEVRNDAQYLVVDAQTLLYGRDIDVKGRVLIKLWRFPEYEYGDFIEVKGSLQKPAEFESFSYSDYLAKEDIYAVMYRPRVVLIDRSSRIDGLSLTFALKDLVKAEINKLFAAPGSSIILGLLLGMRASIPQDILDDFQRSGLTHILAISGYNITLLITIFGLIMKPFGRRLRFIVICSAIAFFALLTGLSASVVRASLMGMLLVFMIFQGRKTDGMIILLFSVFLMVFVNPRILVWDVSFQLSFVSTLGLMVLMPLLEGFAKKMPPFIGEGLLVTLAAIIFTTPVVLYYFGTFSLISPFANVLFLPFIPLIMFFSFLALMSSFLFLPVTFLLVGICWILLFVFIKGVSTVASVPFAFVQISTFPLWAVVVYYFLLWRLITFFRRPRLRQGG